MFKSLKLKNFRQHTNAEFNFTAGLNVIKGNPEAGKSALLEGIAYALSGARSLREPLALTVTWGQKEGSLSSELVFCINGVDYRVTRSKAGAELYVGPRLVVTGQTEVTKYCETLLGASADTTSKMMMANQTALRGALSDGPAATVALIESLANFSLIDEIVELVQTKLPTGNTKALEGQIALLADQIKDTPADETGDAQAKVTSAQLAADASAGKVALLAADLAALQPEHTRLAALQQTFERAEWDVVAANNDRLKAEINLIKELPPEVDQSAIEALSKDLEVASNWAAAEKLHQALTNLPPCDEWEGDSESLAEAISDIDKNFTKVKAVKDEQKANLAQARSDLRAHQTKLINDKVCAFCHKDLSDVPEVLAFNATWTPKIKAAETEVARLNALIEQPDNLADLQSERADLVAVQKAAAARVVVYRNAAAYASFDEAFVPARWTWTGPDLSVPVDLAKLQKQLASLKADAAQRERLIGSQQTAQAALDKALEVLGEREAAVGPAKAAAVGWEEVSGSVAKLTVQLDELKAAKFAVDHDLTSAQVELRHARALHRQRLDAFQLLVGQHTTAVQTLKDTGFNNAMLQKLRTAKPQVADKLWGMVLASVSKYFTSIRGTAGVVTRVDNSFQVNGQSIGGLSGSTLDSLGLAIRIALTKTFLPNTRFMTLDEPTAACNEERSTAMLGVIATADFDQVLLVTHSDLADSFASQVIQL